MMLFSLEAEIKIHIADQGAMRGPAALAPCPEEPHLPQHLSWASLGVAGTMPPYVPWMTCDAMRSVASQKTAALGRLLLSPHSTPDRGQARTAPDGHLREGLVPGLPLPALQLYFGF